MKISCFFAGIFIFFLGCFPGFHNAFLYGQSEVRLNGYVSDAANGEPLAGAVIYVINTSFVVTSEQDGYFVIENLPQGIYDIGVSHLGYKSVQLNSLYVPADQPRRIFIKLPQAPLQSDSIFVFASQDNPMPDIEGDKIIIDSDRIEQLKNLGLPGILQQVAGIQMQTSGSGSGRMVIRIHGGTGNQVLVLLDGQRLNNPQTGEVDLNMIPLESIDKIEIIPHGNTAVYGSSAFDGIVNFQTRKMSPKSGIDIKSYAGSFSTAGGDAVVNLNIGGAELFTDYHQDYSTQNFQYQHEREKFTRQNAWSRNHKIFSKLSYHSFSHDLNLLVNYHQGQQGLPSSFYEEMLNYNARSDFTFATFQINDRWLIHPHLYLRTLMGYHRLNQFFNNEEDPSPFTRYKSRQVNNLSEIKSELFFMLNSAVTFRTGIDVLQEQLNSENQLYPQYSIGQKKRNTFSIFACSEWSVTLLKRIFKANNWRVALRYEKYFNLPGSIYPFLGFSFIPYYISFVSISGSWARSIRYPDFNSLFWKGDARSRGNPELLPEKKDQWNIGIRTTWSGRFLPSVSIYLYREEITDLIFWHRNVQGIWEPRNEAKVSKRGTDMQLDQILIPGHLQYQLGYSHIQALNKSDEPNRYDKMIVFIPQNSWSSSLRSQLGAFQLTLLYRYVSERQVTAANTGTPLNPYTIWDLLASYNWEMASFKLELGGAIKNFTGSDYELIRGYPMPGREYRLSLAVKYHSN